MSMISRRIPYRQTNSFSKIVLDYIDQSSGLKNFYQHTPSIQGIRDAIEARMQFATPRQVLVSELQQQYQHTEHTAVVKNNIEGLLHENTFTITTAHQPNILLGPLYYLYKIIHAIKLADHLNGMLPQYKFVPVFYMGSEDADFDELGYFNLGRQKHTWQTNQQGAVGRMLIDKNFIELIHTVEGQLGVLPFGNELTSLIRQCYTTSETIQSATFKFLNALFGDRGLVVLIPDSKALKSQVQALFKDDLLHQTASEIVEDTSIKLGEHYKVQASPREINLFYLADGIRNRIEAINDKFYIHHTNLSFSKNEMLDELSNHPERFSPNVILRGMFQETILPNIAFVGGGGELAYWLQLKELFTHYKVPFPVLVLRNSYLLVEKKWQERIAKLDLYIDDFFYPASQVVDKVVRKETQNQLQLNGELNALADLYEKIRSQAGAIDPTLNKHVAALEKQSLSRLQVLEKKMFRAEKRKFAERESQVNKISEHLFPSGGLQERYESFMYYYAQWGKQFLDELYNHAPVLEHEFTILSEK